MDVASAFRRFWKANGVEPRGSDVRSEILRLMWPAMIEMILLQAVQVINMMMVGRLGPVAVAAVGVTNQPIFMALSVFVALNVGTTALVARYIGAGDFKAAKEVARQSMIVTAILGILVSLLGYLLAGYAMIMMGAGPDVVETGIRYFRLISISLLFGTLATCASSIFRGAGDTRIPMIVNIATNVMVVILNSIFIYGRLGIPPMGVIGSGVSTILARVFGACLFILALHDRRAILRVPLKPPFRLSRKVLGPMLYIGFPSAAEQFFLQTGLILFARIITGLGTVTFAAHQIAANIHGMSFTPGQAFAIACVTLVGQNLGAGRPDRAEVSACEARRLGLYFSSFMGLVFFFGSEHLATLYTTDDKVIKLTSQVLKIIAFFQPIQSSQFIIAGGLRGAGDTKIPLYSTAVSVWLIRLTAAYGLVYGVGLGLAGAWLAFGIDQTFRWLFITLRFKTGKWKNSVMVCREAI
ncbi:MAG TPA: MATE family efflux transporter [Firmicutes bacterium]|nr:MATE family efflux transporter [Bacillota bacterium]